MINVTINVIINVTINGYMIHLIAKTIKSHNDVLKNAIVAYGPIYIINDMPRINGAINRALVLIKNDNDSDNSNTEKSNIYNLSLYILNNFIFIFLT